MFPPKDDYEDLIDFLDPTFNMRYYNALDDLDLSDFEPFSPDLRDGVDDDSSDDDKSVNCDTQDEHMKPTSLKHIIISDSDDSDEEDVPPPFKKKNLGLCFCHNLPFVVCDAIDLI